MGTHTCMATLLFYELYTALWPHLPSDTLVIIVSDSYLSLVRRDDITWKWKKKLYGRLISSFGELKSNMKVSIQQNAFKMSSESVLHII